MTWEVIAIGYGGKETQYSNTAFCCSDFFGENCSVL